MTDVFKTQYLVTIYSDFPYDAEYHTLEQMGYDIEQGECVGSVSILTESTQMDIDDLTEELNTIGSDITFFGELVDD